MAGRKKKQPVIEEPEREFRTFNSYVTVDPNTLSNQDIIPNRVTRENSFGKREAPQLFDFQFRAIHFMLKSENCGYIKLRDGSLIKPSLRINALNTGAGKTMMMRALAEFDILPDDDHFTPFCTSTMRCYFPPDPREILKSTLFLCKTSLVKKWQAECDKFFITNTYTFGTEASIIDGLRDFCVNNFGTDFYGLPKKVEEFYSDPQLTFYINAYYYNIFTNNKAVIISDTCFQYLFSFFNSYIIQRFVIDDMKEATFYNQDQLKKQPINPFQEKLILGKYGESVLSYSKNSFALSIWLVFATPESLYGEQKSTSGSVRFLLDWIIKNNPYIEEYFTKETGDFYFKEVINNTVLKFDEDYVENQKTGGRNFIIQEFVKIEKPLELTVYEDSLFDPVKQKALNDMLSNGEIEEVCRIYSVSNIEDLIGVIFQMNEDKIQELYSELGRSKASGKGYENQAERVAAEETEIRNKMYKTSQKHALVYKTLDSSMIGNCAFCGRECNVKDNSHKILSCPICTCCFHENCLQSDEYFCVNCNTATKIDNLNYISYNHSTGKNTINKNVENKETEDSNDSHSKGIVFANKLDALHFYINYTVTLNNGQQTYLLQKLLLYINFKNESEGLIRIIVKMLLEAGFEVYLPIVMTTKDIERLYGAGASRVHSPGTSRDMVQKIEKFKNTNVRTVMIVSSQKNATGQDFPFIDGIIVYNGNERGLDRKQIIGRARRPERISICRYIEFLSYQ